MTTDAGTLPKLAAHVRRGNVRERGRQVAWGGSKGGRRQQSQSAGGWRVTEWTDAGTLRTSVKITAVGDD